MLKPNKAITESKHWMLFKFFFHCTIKNFLLLKSLWNMPSNRRFFLFELLENWNICMLSFVLTIMCDKIWLQMHFSIWSFIFLCWTDLLCWEYKKSWVSTYIYHSMISSLRNGCTRSKSLCSLLSSPKQWGTAPLCPVCAPLSV